MSSAGDWSSHGCTDSRSRPLPCRGHPCEADYLRLRPRLTTMARMRTRTTHNAQCTTPDAWDTIRNSVGRKRGQSLGAAHRIRCGTVPIFASHVPRRDVALLCVAVLALVAGCGTACRCCRPAGASPASAPERVRIDGREYTLSANAWRDFQPVAPPDGQPLIVVVKVSPSDMMPLPSDIAIDRIWVLNGKKQWSAAPEESGDRGQSTTGQSPVTRLETAVRGGPKWGPGIKVDVVVRLKQGKQTWLVRAPGVEIKRTD